VIKVLDEELYASAKSGTKRRGKLELIKHLEGKRLTVSEAVKAKCYDCDGMGESGECDMESCSLFPYSVYNPNKLKQNRGEWSEDRKEASLRALKAAALVKQGQNEKKGHLKGA
jgi:hypothetical protein